MKKSLRPRVMGREEYFVAGKRPWQQFAVTAAYFCAHKEVAIVEHAYPFAAIVGQEQMKRALLLNLIDPALGGVLIRGEKGTAKSTAVRGLTDLLEEIQGMGGRLLPSQQPVHSGGVHESRGGKTAGAIPGPLRPVRGSGWRTGCGRAGGNHPPAAGLRAGSGAEKHREYPPRTDGRALLVRLGAGCPSGKDSRNAGGCGVLPVRLGLFPRRGPEPAWVSGGVAVSH